MQESELLALATAEGAVPSLLETIFDKGGDEVKAAVIANRSCPQHLVDAGVSSASELQRAAAAGTGKLVEADQVTLANDSSVLVTRKLSESATSSEALAILATSVDPETKRNVAENENVSNATLRTLSQDSDMSVANEARASGRGRGLDVEAVEVLDIAGDLPDDIREALESAGIGIPGTLSPQERHALMTSSDVAERAAFAEREDLNDVEESILAVDPEDDVVRSVARRESLSPAVALMLLGHKNPIVRALACRKAPVEDVEKLFADSDDNIRMMVARKARTPEIQRQLSADGSAYVRRGLAAQARNLNDDVVEVLSGDPDYETRRLIALNAISPKRYADQRINDLREWRDDGWQKELQNSLTAEEYNSIVDLLEVYPGTFSSLCNVAKALV